jgi:hypothetical protein
MAEYRIFVSYSRTDLEIVGPLVQLLRVTADQIFQDIDNIPPGGRWRAILTGAIDGCEAFLLFWCRHSANSTEVKNEYDQALKSDKRIVPVLLDETDLPVPLAEYQAIDLRQVLGGHKEGYVETEAYIPGVTSGYDSKKIVRQWKLLIPDGSLLHGAWYLKDRLGKFIYVSDESA